MHASLLHQVSTILIAAVLTLAPLTTQANPGRAIARLFFKPAPTQIHPFQVRQIGRPTEAIQRHTPRLSSQFILDPKLGYEIGPVMHGLSDKDLYEYICTNERNRISILDRMVRNLLAQKAARYLSNPSDQDDLIQDTLASVLKSCDKFLHMNSAQVHAFISTAMYFRWIDHLRVKYRDAIYMTATTMETEDDSEPEIEDPRTPPQYLYPSLTEKRLCEIDAIQAALSKSGLSPRQREAIELVALGYSREEIATKMGISKDRVNELVYDARCRLKSVTDKTDRQIYKPVRLTPDELARRL